MTKEMEIKASMGYTCEDFRGAVEGFSSGLLFHNDNSTC